LYAFVRGSGKGPDEAADLTQEFFSRLLEKKWLKEADPARGKVRTFLLAALKNFLTNEWHRERAQKRGGGQELIALDALEAEERFALEPRDMATPDALFERRWAMTLIGRAQDRLRDEMTRSGGADRFAALEPTLIGDRTEVGYEELAARFGMAEGGVKSMVRRLRSRFRELMREEIAATLEEGEDIDAELQELLTALRNL
jgi:RNA polymerase sigma-70 factor (ECF subfamily)